MGIEKTDTTFPFPLQTGIIRLLRSYQPQWGSSCSSGFLRAGNTGEFWLPLPPLVPCSVWERRARKPREDCLLFSPQRVKLLVRVSRQSFIPVGCYARCPNPRAGREKASKTMELSKREVYCWLESGLLTHPVQWCGVREPRALAVTQIYRVSISS